MTVQYHRITSDFNQIINEVQLAIPEAPYDVIEFHVKRAIVEFCSQSHYWREDIGPVPVVASTNTYDIPVSKYQRPISIAKIVATKGDDEKELHRTEDETVKYRFFQYSDFAFEVYPHAELVGYQLSVITVLEPVPSGPTNIVKVSESVVTAWHDALVSGAIARIKKIPKKPWTDLQDASLNAQAMTGEASRARREASRGYSGSPDKPVKKAKRFY